MVGFTFFSIPYHVSRTLQVSSRKELAETELLQNRRQMSLEDLPLGGFRV